MSRDTLEQARLESRRATSNRNAMVRVMRLGGAKVGGGDVDRALELLGLALHGVAADTGPLEERAVCRYCKHPIVRFAKELLDEYDQWRHDVSGLERGCRAASWSRSYQRDVDESLSRTWNARP